MRQEIIFEVTPMLPTTGARVGSNSFPRVFFRSNAFPFRFGFARRENAMPWEINSWAYDEPQWFMEFPTQTLEERFTQELHADFDPLSLTLFCSELGGKIADLMPAIERWFKLFPRGDVRLNERTRYDLECRGYELLPKTFSLFLEASSEV